MCNEECKECNPEKCQCQSDNTEKNLASLLYKYEKELAECEAAMKRTNEALRNLEIQRQQLIGAKYAISCARKVITEDTTSKPVKGEDKDG